MVAKETPGSIAMVLCIWQTTFLHIRHRGMMLARLFLDARFSPETKREEQKDCDSDNENGDDGKLGHFVGEKCYYAKLGTPSLLL